MSIDPKLFKTLKAPTLDEVFAAAGGLKKYLIKKDKKNAEYLSRLSFELYTYTHPVNYIALFLRLDIKDIAGLLYLFYFSDSDKFVFQKVHLIDNLQNLGLSWVMHIACILVLKQFGNPNISFDFSDTMKKLWKSTLGKNSMNLSNLEQLVQATQNALKKRGVELKL